MALNHRKFVALGIIVTVLVAVVAIAIDVRGQHQLTQQSENLRGCVQLDNAYNCLQQRARVLFSRLGADATLARVAQDVSDSDQMQSFCHGLTHEIGHLAWNQAHDIARAFASGKDHATTCSDGFYHGVMESAIEAFPRDQISQWLPGVCASFAQRPMSFNHYNCVHGLGHGLLALFADQWQPALDGCAVLATPWEQQSCASGVFMQNIVNEIQAVGHKPDFRNDDIQYPCSVTAEQWKASCYLIHASHILNVYGGDFTKTFAACEQVPTAYRPTCYQSVGRDVSGRNRGRDGEVIRLCQLAGTGAQDCVVGAARDYVYHDHSRRLADRLCAAVPHEFQSACMNAVDSDANTL